MRLVLASTSPARRAVLTAAGITPVCFAPTVDEAAAVAAAENEQGTPLTAAETVDLLAKLKARDVAARYGSAADGLVLGGDSVFLLDGEVLGKPHYPDVALGRAKKHRGRTGTLHSGHCLLEVKNGEIVGEASLTDTALVTLAPDVTDAELAAYVASGEPLKLAGGFAIDGRAGAFISGIQGSPSCVMGLSLPALRQLVRRLGYEYTALWTASA
ncbi:Maf family protein [Canibacter zhoujuaniae]|uniref:Maf family protein n=1 Tax=Canibacter zhoujuaniae TaxID=2708343 RepID=UPI001423D333|nr:Maf family nucleotide pyrophosphatase [Canibacter zhoujuaniae]